VDFDVIYRENAEIVYRYLFSLCCDAHLAEEVTAQTFYEAIRSAGKYRGEAALSTWLCAIGRRLLQKEWKRQKKHTVLPLEEGTVTFAQAEKTLVCRKIYRQDLDTAAMPPEMVQKYYTEDAPHTMFVGEVVRIL